MSINHSRGTATQPLSSAIIFNETEKMLREIKTEKNKENGLLKRWFNDHNMDLFVWCLKKGEVTKFQLCYDKNHIEHALTWDEEIGFLHNMVDDGEGRPGKYKGTPILVLDGQFNSNLIADKCKDNSKYLNDEIFQYVYKKTLSFPNV